MYYVLSISTSSLQFRQGGTARKDGRETDSEIEIENGI